MKPISRIVVCNGTSQLMFATACLEHANSAIANSADTQNHLIVYTIDHSESRETATKQLADGLYKWDSIQYFKIDSDLAKPFDLPSQCFTEPDELWFCMPTNPVEKALQRCYRKAKVVFFEDGLHAYNDLFQWSLLFRNPRRACRWLLWKARRMAARAKLRDEALFPGRPIDSTYLLLGDQFKVASQYRPLGKQHSVSADILKRVALRISSFAEESELRIESPDKTVVFLGSIFSECGMAKWSDEFDVYCEIVRRVTERDYLVLWKEHPRAQNPFGDKLKEMFPGRVSAHSINKLIPAEVFFACNQVAACISPHSTSLLTLPAAFGTKTFHLIDFCEGFYNSAYGPAVELVRNNVLPLSKFL